ncbi:MBL fold metallo-hydrolase [Azospirillum halopraeferens]|uniref:MBL fold metallo-hydrolase n=1 Tax=Azospirillum halopraeferens TaxID=34010 RepID=UPI0004283AF7|nr:MBL fold metallo-hydrolase [Azospirillum halopraeferens]
MDYTVTFWGVRGTVPCPLRSHMEFGGNTACIEVRVAGHTVFLDAGTGLRLPGRRLVKEGVRSATLLLSHAHLDHISGFPFFAPAYTPGFDLRIIGGRADGGPGIETALTRQMERPLFPVPLRTMGGDLNFREVTAGDSFDLGEGVRVRTAPLNHPDGATAFRIDWADRSLAYVTDTEHVPGAPDRAVLDLIAGADLVVYDATYTDDEFARRVGWGHSTWSEGVRLCRRAGVGRLALFHHDPDHDDAAMAAIEAEARAVWPPVFAAREGTTLDLLAGGPPA